TDLVNGAGFGNRQDSVQVATHTDLYSPRIDVCAWRREISESHDQQIALPGGMRNVDVNAPAVLNRIDAGRQGIDVDGHWKCLRASVIQREDRGSRYEG